MFYRGATGRTRTGDPRITNALLYQLSHSSRFIMLFDSMLTRIPAVAHIEMRCSSLANNGRLARWSASQFSLFAHLTASLHPPQAAFRRFDQLSHSSRFIMLFDSMLTRIPAVAHIEMRCSSLANNGRLARWSASQFSLFAHLTASLHPPQAAFRRFDQLSHSSKLGTRY